MKSERFEQEFIVSNMNGSGPSGTVVGPKASGEQVRNLVYNAYFRDHLSAADYRSLLEAQQKETLPGRLIARYMSNYARLDSLAAQYAATSDRQQADEIYSRLSVVRSLNEAVGDSLAGVWGFIYDNKVYAYGYLLDKMGKTELLADFEAGSGKTGSRSWPCRTALRRWRCTDIRCRSSSCFLMRRRWPICSALRLHPIRWKNVWPRRPAFRTECRKSTRRAGCLSFTPTSRRTTPSVYNARNPIRERDRSVRHGLPHTARSVSAKAAVSIFKGVSPLCYDRTEEGRYRYCAGAFRELSEAEAAWAKLKEMGFRKPEIVVWRDGVFEMIGSGSGTSSKDGGPLYRIEISGQQENISDEIREIVSRQARARN